MIVAIFVFLLIGITVMAYTVNIADLVSDDNGTPATTITIIENFEAPDVDDSEPDGNSTTGLEFYDFASNSEVAEITNESTSPKVGLQSFEASNDSWTDEMSVFSFTYPEVCPAYDLIEYRFAISNQTSNQTTLIELYDCSTALIVANEVSTYTWNDSGDWVTNISILYYDWDGTTLLSFDTPVNLSNASELYYFRAVIDYTVLPDYSWNVSLYDSSETLIDYNVSNLTCENPKLLTVSGDDPGDDQAIYLDNLRVTYVQPGTASSESEVVDSAWTWFTLAITVIAIVVIVSLLLLLLTKFNKQK